MMNNTSYISIVSDSFGQVVQVQKDIDGQVDISKRSELIETNMEEIYVVNV